MKILIATFSQTGSTRKIAEAIAAGMSASDAEVIHHSIGKDEMPDLSDFDIIGIGTSTYMFRPPFPVMDFVNQLDNINNKPSFVFITHGTHQGDCGNWIRRKLKTKGITDLGYFESFGADYWLGYVKRGVLFSPGSPNQSDLSTANDFGRRVVLRFQSGSKETEAYDPPTPIVYSTEKFLTSRMFAKLMYSKTFRVNKNCDNCGICIRKCPVKNIEVKKNKKLKWHSDCILCATCELSCPKDAIHSAFDWWIFAPFMWYNIWQSKKKGIFFARVVHKKGKTDLV